VSEDPSKPVEIGGDNRRAECHRLQRHPRGSFEQRRDRQDIRRHQEITDVRPMAQHPHMLRSVYVVCQCLANSGSRRSVLAGNEQDHRRMVSTHDGHRLDQINLTLLILESPEVHDDGYLVIDAEPSASDRTAFRCSLAQRTRVAPAFGDADPVGRNTKSPRICDHRTIGHAVESIDEEPPRDGVDGLDRSQLQPVHVRVRKPRRVVGRTHEARHDRRACTGSGQTAHHIRIEERRVHDVRCSGSDQSAKLPKLGDETTGCQTDHVDAVRDGHVVQFVRCRPKRDDRDVDPALA
jgi:hypothetical protein